MHVVDTATGYIFKRVVQRCSTQRTRKINHEEFELKILYVLKIDDREQICAQDMELTSLKYNEGKMRMT